MSSSSSPALSEGSLASWGARIGAWAVEGNALPLVLALRGPLGAGKSVLARAVARGAGVVGPMPSPTYNLLFQYPGRGGIVVYHIDLYRLEDPDDVWELGWAELGEGRELVLIEWPERAEHLLSPDRWDVELAFAGGADPSADSFRRVRLSRRGDPPELPPFTEGWVESPARSGSAPRSPVPQSDPAEDGSDPGEGDS